MEADSTTLDNSSKDGFTEPKLPFISLPENIMLYKELTNDSSDRNLETQIIERLQAFGLIPMDIKCPTGQPNCKLFKKAARVIDKVQWACVGCSKTQSIRTSSFFLRIQCSILQALQIILAWCEDADCETAAQHFGVKPKVASVIYDRLDELAVKEQLKCKLGGDGSVVLTEMYPDCITSLSPDTTDTEAHVHRVLMIADSKHVPTRYHLHIVKDDVKKTSSLNSAALRKEVKKVLSQRTVADSNLVIGSHIPNIDGAITIHQLVQHSDAEMQRFLTNSIWRQAITLCAASRDFCLGASSPSPAPSPCTRTLPAQRYLHTSLYRLTHTTDFYRHMLQLLADEYTDKVLRKQ